VKHEVRLIGGQWKRSRLPVADRPGLRPTPDRVRETLFNWLGQDLAGWRVLDAFAGSGALGFEAASRGAREVVLLERDAVLARSLAASKQRLHADVLRDTPVAFFTVGLTLALDPGRADEVRRCTDRLVEDTGVVPVDVGVFAGWYHPERFGLGERIRARVLSFPVGDFRDLAAVDRWTAAVAPLLKPTR